MGTKHVAKTLLLTALLATTFVLRAESFPEDIIKYRKNVMKTNGANMADAAMILQGKVEEYKGRLADHAKAVETFTKDIPALFPEGSDLGDTEALDVIWKKWPEFQRKAKDAHAAAVAFAKAVASKNEAAINAKFKQLSDDCKACHKDFRKEEK